VQGVDPDGTALLERIDVTRAQQPQLRAHVVGLQRVPPEADVVHADVVVLEPVDDEDGGLDLVGVLVVVAVTPPLVDVAVLVTVELVLLRSHRCAEGLAGDRAVRCLHHRRAQAGVRVEPGDATRQAARVIVVVADACGARVVVPSGDRADRDDRLEALDAGGGDAVGERAVIGLADHGRRAVVPVGGAGRGPVHCGVARDAAVEPVDDGLEAGDVSRAAVPHAARGERGAERVRGDERVPARDEVVVVEQREAIQRAVLVGDDPLALVATPVGGVVRTRVDDRRDLDRRPGLLGTHDVDRDPVDDAVAVCVGVRDRDEDPLAHRLRVVEDRRGLAVSADRHHRRLRLCDAPTQAQCRQRQRARDEPTYPNPHTPSVVSDLLL
jgi:hypothetical protein